MNLAQFKIPLARFTLSRELARLRYEATYEEVDSATATAPVEAPANGADQFEPDETLNLDHRVQKFLAESGITGQYALAMGCYFADCSVVSKASGIAEERLSSLGAIALPYPGVKNLDGTPFIRFRQIGVKEKKYVGACGQPNAVYIPPNYADRKWNKLLVIVEGEKKAALLNAKGIRALGISGVGNWFDDAARAAQKESGQGLNKDTLPHKLLLQEALKASMVIVLVDSDAHNLDKPEIRASMEALKLALDHYIRLHQQTQAIQPDWNPILTPRNIPVMLVICPPRWEINVERNEVEVTGCKVEMHRQGVDDLYLTMLASQRDRTDRQNYNPWEDCHRLDNAKVIHRLNELLMCLGLADLGVADSQLAVMVASENQRQLAYKRGSWMYYDEAQGIWDEADANNEHAAPVRVADQFETAQRVVKQLVNPISKAVDGVPVTMLTSELRQWIDQYEEDAKKLGAAAFRLKSTKPQKDILTQTKRMVSIPVYRWNTNKDVFAAANGLVDLRTGALLPHAPENLITMASKFPYDPFAACPLWETFLTQVQPDEDVRKYLQALMGYCATGHINMQKIYIFKGDGGNGKGVFMETLRKVLGSYSCVGSKTLILKHRNSTPHPTDKAHLEGKRWVTFSELSDSGALDASALKELSGENELSARKMHKDLKDFEMQATIVLDTNDVPYCSDNSASFVRRLEVIDWAQSFTGNPDVELKHKLAAEHLGILARVVEGARMYYSGELTKVPAAVLAATAKLWSEIDTVACWIDEKCVREASAETDLKTLGESYFRWCTANRTPPIINHTLGKRLRFAKFTSRKSNGPTLFAGIRLKTTAEESSSELSDEDIPRKPVASETNAYRDTIQTPVTLAAPAKKLRRVQ